MKNFEYEPSRWVPFRDKEVIGRVRKIKRADINKNIWITGGKNEK